MSVVPSTTDDLPAVAKEVEQFVDAAGWDQPPQLFALVATAELMKMQPELADQLDPASTLTPIAQDSLPDGDLGEALAGIMWPDAVQGCALVQEIVVLPPEAEAEVDDAEDEEHLRQLVAEHPDRQEARLVAAVLRNGGEACVMRLRNHDDLVTSPDLAPNLTAALHATFS
ncbi:PPA1309 family protein [Kibdelosporangium banguiense]|nr:PPA1309 family protein [Kibdelosporangium banguiense]